MQARRRSIIKLTRASYYPPISTFSFCSVLRPFGSQSSRPLLQRTTPTVQSLVRTFANVAATFVGRFNICSAASGRGVSVCHSSCSHAYGSCGTLFIFHFVTPYISRLGRVDAFSNSPTDYPTLVHHGPQSTDTLRDPSHPPQELCPSVRHRAVWLLYVMFHDLFSKAIAVRSTRDRTGRYTPHFQHAKAHIFRSSSDRS